MRVIVAGLQSVSQPRNQTRAGVAFAQVLDVALQMASPNLVSRARLVREVRGEPHVLGNHGQLVQVVLNLLMNAAQAIPEGALATGEVRVAVFEEAGRAILEVSDTGVGIAPADRERIFDPFFTTKPVGTGTGLGLSISRGIVLAHGGQITVEGRQAGGSTFRVSLPAMQGSKEH